MGVSRVAKLLAVGEARMSLVGNLKTAGSHEKTFCADGSNGRRINTCRRVCSKINYGTVGGRLHQFASVARSLQINGG